MAQVIIRSHVTHFTIGFDFHLFRVGPIAPFSRGTANAGLGWL
jgi:hypothetical protein